MDAIYDKQFLLALDQQNLQEKYVKLVALDFDDTPVATIEGIISGGSISVDGTSAIRRTCNITLVSEMEENDIADPYWCFNTKIDIKIGIRNYVNSEYSSIIWFDMGIFLLNSFSISKSTNNLSVSISGKDKMCRLNGEMGGLMPSEWNWGSERYVDNETNTSTITKIPLKTIIYNIVREMGQERPENIIIRDLDTYGYELWKYRGHEPIYYLRRPSGNIQQLIFDQSKKVTLALENTALQTIKISELEDKNGKYYALGPLDPSYNKDASKIVLGTKKTMDEYKTAKEFNVIRISYGEAAGRYQIPLVFNDDLVAGVGEAATSVLDKIKNMLGNYEYFYNEKGQFVFQRKNDYVQELFSTSTGALSEPMMSNAMYSYRFENEKQLISKSNSINMKNIKNDFVVWGTRSSSKASIHARCAIDTKPTSYKSPWSRIYRVATIVESPMRPMVKDYYYKKDNVYKTGTYSDNKKEGKTVVNSISYNFSALKLISSDNGTLEPGHELFTYKNKQIYISSDSNNGKTCWCIVKGTLSPDSSNVSVRISYEINNKQVGEVKTETWAISKTFKLLEEYDKYVYVELYANRVYKSSQYDWRELIYQMALDYRKHGTDPDYYILLEQANSSFKKGKTGYENYYIDLEGHWRTLYDPNPIGKINEYYRSGAKKYWNKKIHTDPESLSFWFEFLDVQGELKKYSVRNIGQRQKILNESTVTSIYLKNIPEIQYYVAGEEWEKETTNAYTPIQLSEQDKLLFYKGSMGNSAINRINNLITNHLNLSEGLNITTTPIYYLQPNTRIYIANEGDYTINKITYNLNYNGTMSISGSKIYQQWN